MAGSKRTWDGEKKTQPTHPQGGEVVPQTLTEAGAKGDAVCAYPEIPKSLPKDDEKPTIFGQSIMIGYNCNESVISVRTIVR